MEIWRGQPSGTGRRNVLHVFATHLSVSLGGNIHDDGSLCILGVQVLVVGKVPVLERRS